MASRWPEAMALRSVTAEAVASGMCEITFRTGIPLKVLTDRGSVFVGKPVSKRCEGVGIDKVHTSPYRPQSNGVLEKFHGTLKPMLGKALIGSCQWHYSPSGRSPTDLRASHPMSWSLGDTW